MYASSLAMMQVAWLAGLCNVLAPSQAALVLSLHLGFTPAWLWLQCVPLSAPLTMSSRHDMVKSHDKVLQCLCSMMAALSVCPVPACLVDAARSLAV